MQAILTRFGFDFGRIFDRLAEPVGVGLVMLSWTCFALHVHLPGYWFQVIASLVWVPWALRRGFPYVAALNAFLMVAAVIAIVRHYGLV